MVLNFLFPFQNYIFRIWEWGGAISFRDNVSKSRSSYEFSELWKVSIFFGNIYSFKSNTYFRRTVINIPIWIFIFCTDQARIYSVPLCCRRSFRFLAITDTIFCRKTEGEKSLLCSSRTQHVASTAVTDWWKWYVSNPPPPPPCSLGSGSFQRKAFLNLS